MIRVLIVGKFYHPFRGGMETHLRELCRRLAESVDVSVAVSSPDHRTRRELIDGIPVIRLGTIAMIASAPVNLGMARVVRAFAGDIVHVHLPHPTAILSYLWAGHTGPLVVTYHSDIVRQKVLGRLFEPILHRFLSRSAAIICTSPGYIASSPVLQLHRDRCEVIPFSIATERFDAVDPAIVASIRAEFGGRLVLAVGRLVSYKGFEYLIRAMPHVRGTLVIIGTGPLREELGALSRRLGLDDRVRWLGEVADVAPYHRAADCFVLPSVERSEAFGLVQLEAMACSTPVVNTALASGVPYVSVHEETGLTVQPRDPAGLADAINRLLDDHALRCRYGAAARRRVDTFFTVDAMVASTIDLYDRVVAKRDRT